MSDPHTPDSLYITITQQAEKIECLLSALHIMVDAAREGEFHSGGVINSPALDVARAAFAKVEGKK